MSSVVVVTNIEEISRMDNLLDPTDSQRAHMERRRSPGRRRVKGPSFDQKVRDWCRSRSATFRVPFGAWFAFMIVAYLFATDSAAGFDVVNGLIHRLGHGLGGILPGEELGVAGGWILQFGTPLIAFIVFWRTFDYFGAAVTFAWFGTALLWNVPYIAGAADKTFPESIAWIKEPAHDWNALLTAMNALDDIGAMKATLWGFGLLALALGLTLACNQLYFMWTLEERRKESDRRVIKAGEMKR